ncbi:hypothetical protein [Streptomyces longisporoflavus]|uniref:Uncharacterized protein n=1 Tax=Streptomyces longisporoflavus TaxID=28044 RepID=A0ABW7QZP5_9ACTN
MRSVRRLAKLLAVPVLAWTSMLGIGLWAAEPAAAKGPQSAVLISAATDRTVVLTEDDPDVRTLARLLPPYRENAVAPSPPRVEAGTRPDTGRQITVLWRGGNDTVFSVDAVLPAYDGGRAWVRKEDNLLGGRFRDSWHRADPALLPLMDRLGLYDRAAQPRPAATHADATLAPEQDAATHWRWAAAALTAGLLLGAAAIPGLRRLRGRHRPPSAEGTGQVA